MEALRELTQSIWFGIGRGSAAAYAAHEAWLFRRVETIEFVGRRSVKRSVSVDFEVPSGLPDLGKHAAKGTVLVPISVFDKWPPLMDFNFVDPSGHPASRYRGTTSNQLNFGLMLGMVDRAFALGESRAEHASWEARRHVRRRIGHPEPERLPLTLRRELASVVQSPRPSQAAVERAVNGLRAALGTVVDREVTQNDEEIATHIAATVDLAARLAGSSILWAAVQGSPGTDRIMKFSYLDTHGASTIWWKRFLTACSWRRRTLTIPLSHAGRHVRYHLDIRAPHGSVELVVAEALAFPPAAGADDVGDAEVRSVENLAGKYLDLDVPDEWVGPESSRYLMDYGDPIVLASTSPTPARRRQVPAGTDHEASAEIVDRRMHLYLGARSAPSHRVLLQVELAAMRHGFIRGCMTAALMIAALMSIAYVSLSSAALHLEETVVLLSVVPVVLGYVLVRPGEDPLERYHVSGVRAMALLSGATPILGALTLVLTHTTAHGSPPDLTLARPIWLALLAISGLMAAGLVRSLLVAAPPSERDGRAARSDVRHWGSDR